jgi:hypothetical protein
MPITQVMKSLAEPAIADMALGYDGWGAAA